MSVSVHGMRVAGRGAGGKARQSSAMKKHRNDAAKRQGGGHQPIRPDERDQKSHSHSSDKQENIQNGIKKNH